MTSSSTESVRSLPFTWRVSRYDPALRDEHGSYTARTWTSIADVGAVFEGRELTLDEYQRVEDAYAAAFLAFADEAAVTQLQVRQLEHGGNGLRDRALLTLSEAAEVLRSMLREQVVCKLESPENDFFVHVGFDLYMYVGSARPCPNAVARARALGLHVDLDWPSPQLPEDSAA